MFGRVGVCDPIGVPAVFDPCLAWLLVIITFWAIPVPPKMDVARLSIKELVLFAFDIFKFGRDP